MSLKPSAIVVADGGIDLPEGYAERFGIKVLPLMVHFGSETLRSGVDISPAEFYRRLREGDVWPTTSQPSAGEYLEFYRDLGKEGLPILSFHLSAGLSGSVNSARTARAMLPDLEIHNIDTGTLSAAQAMQVLVAAEMAANGEPVADILARCKEIGEKTDILFTCDTLEYLRKGGRIGAVAGYVGSLLGIRPIITVDKKTGTYVPAGRTRSFRTAAAAMVQKIVDTVGENSSVSVIVLHGDCLKEAEHLAELLRERLRCVWLEIGRANPALGVHVGPDTLGIGYFAGALPVKRLLSPVNA